MDSKTLYAKLATVPGPVKQWLGSVGMSEKNEELEKQFTLPEGSAGTIAKLIQRLQIKDLAPEYFSGQLALALNLDKNEALLIVDEIKKSVFFPIKNELASYGIDVSLLDKFDPTAPKPSAGPMIVSSDKPMPVIASPQPPTPAPLSDKGWSTIPAPMSFSAMPGKIPVGIPAPSVMPMPRPPVAPAGMAQSNVSSLPVPPQAPKPAPMPTMIIRGDNAPKPIKNAPDFHTKSAESILPTRISASALARPVVLEMTGMPAPIPGKTAVPTPLAPQMKPDVTRVVHYSDFKSSLPTQLPVGKMPVAESGRQLVEMTAATPLPQTPIPKPMPTPAMPKPPIAPMLMPKIVIAAPSPMMAQPMAPAMPAVPNPPMPKLTMMPSTQMPPLPPRPTNPPIPAAAAMPRPIPEKIIVKDFTEGK